jgi:hypothetical protein
MAIPAALPLELAEVVEGLREALDEVRPAPADHRVLEQIERHL